MVWHSDVPESDKKHYSEGKVHLITVIYVLVSTAFRCPYTNSLDAKQQAAYDRVIECISKGTHADEPGHSLPYETAICDAFKVMDLCIIKPFDVGDSHSSEILDFYRAYQLQRVILTRKSKLCPEPLPYQRLKVLVVKSGIMQRENLPSIENDTYVPCAGEVSLKCFGVALKRWEHHSNILNVFFAYIDCYDKETKTCDSDMARHINTVIQAFKIHLQEKHGLFAGMIKEIDH